MHFFLFLLFACTIEILPRGGVTCVCHLDQFLTVRFYGLFPVLFRLYNSACLSRKLPEFSRLKRCFLYFGNLQFLLCCRKSGCYACSALDVYYSVSQLFNFIFELKVLSFHLFYGIVYKSY